CCWRTGGSLRVLLVQWSVDRHKSPQARAESPVRSSASWAHLAQIWKFPASQRSANFDSRGWKPDGARLVPNRPMARRHGRKSWIQGFKLGSKRNLRRSNLPSGILLPCACRPSRSSLPCLFIGQILGYGRTVSDGSTRCTVELLNGTSSFRRALNQG